MAAALFLAALLCASPTVPEDPARLVQSRIDEHGLGWQAKHVPPERVAVFAGQALPEDPTRVITPRPAAGDAHPAAWPALGASTTDAYFSWDDRDGDNYVTGVRDQGGCGSCFVFAALAVVEAQFAIALGEPGYDADLSEQDVLSCLSMGSCESGGTAQEVGSVLKDTGAVDERCQPYLATQTSCGDGRCGDWESRTTKIIDWHTSVLPPSEAEIKQMLLAGPVVANMRLYDDFYYYGSGVYSPAPEAAAVGWHAVALIGWNDAADSWIAKNSWGAEWGDNGFFEIARGDDCGFLMLDGVCFATNAVTFDVDATAAPAGPCIDETSVSLVGDTGDDTLRATFTVRSCGGGSLQWQAGYLPSGVTLSPASGALAPGEAMPVSVVLDTARAMIGSYSTELTVSSQGSVEARLGLAVSLTLYTAPAVDFTATPLSGTAPLTVRFSDATVGALDSRAWEFGDDTTGSGVEPSHVYDQPGRYTVTLTGSDRHGEHSKTRISYITVLAAGEGGDVDGDDLEASPSGALTSGCSASGPTTLTALCCALALWLGLRRRTRG